MLRLILFTNKTKNLFLIVGFTLTLLMTQTDVSGQNDFVPLPPGFTSTRIINSGLHRPVDIEFAPNGDMFILEKGNPTTELQEDDAVAALKLYKNGAVRPEPVIQLSVFVELDQGAIALALDPDFSSNGYFYIYRAVWNRDRPDLDIPAYERLSRFTYDHQREIALRESERVLLDIYEHGEVHPGGGLVFDNQGYLYLVTGEFSGLPDENGIFGPQDLSSYAGKVLRVRPTYDGSEPPYTIPDTNPYITNPNARPEIYALGFRNPFRSTHRQSDDLILIADVGRIHYEELNILHKQANYGWPEREGLCLTGVWEPCEAADQNIFVDPVVSIAHEYIPEYDLFTGAITGVAFYEGNSWPEEYHNKLFFAEFALDYVGVADIDTGEFSIFQTAYTGVDIEFFNDKMYFVRLGGMIIEVTYTGSGNNIPISSISADRTDGDPPFDVTFTATASDADGDELIYHWDFGDGTSTTTTTPIVTHTYLENVTASAVLQVEDIHGALSQQSSELVTIYSGLLPQIVLENNNRPISEPYHAGDTINFSIELPESQRDGKTYKWDVLFHHNTHIHPFTSGIIGESGSTTIPKKNHDGDHQLWYEWVLTMYTETGQAVRVSQELFPSLTNISLNSTPNHAPIRVNGGPQTTPFVYQSIVGQENKIESIDPDTMLAEWETTMDESAVVKTSNQIEFEAPPFTPTFTGTLSTASDSNGIFGGSVWSELDGISNSGDEVYASRSYTLILFNVNDGTTQSTQSNAGTFLFDSVPFGDYILTIVAPNGKTVTPSYGVDDLIIIGRNNSVGFIDIGIVPAPTAITLSEEDMKTHIWLPVIVGLALGTSIISQKVITSRSGNEEETPEQRIHLR